MDNAGSNDTGSLLKFPLDETYPVSAPEIHSPFSRHSFSTLCLCSGATGIYPGTMVPNMDQSKVSPPLQSYRYPLLILGHG